MAAFLCFTFGGLLGTLVGWFGCHYRHKLTKVKDAVAAELKAK